MLDRLYANKVSVGRTVKRTGRVEGVKAVEKQAIEKNEIDKSGTSPIEKRAGLATDLGKGMLMSGGMALAGITAASAANYAASKVRSAMDKPKFESSFQKALQTDAFVNNEYKKNPERVRGFFNLVVDASPSIASNPLVLANYLRLLMQYGGDVNFMKFQELVNLENVILRNRDLSNPLTNIAQKAVIDGAMKGVGQSEFKRGYNEALRSMKTQGGTP